jgi:hypothetical protein
MRFAGTQLSNFMGDTTDFSQIAGTSQKGRSMERRAVMQGEAMVGNAGVQSLGKMKSAEAQADAIVAGGQAQGQASMASGLGSMFSGLAGGLGSMGGGSANTGFSGASMKATSAVPRNAYSTYTPSYNFFS